MKLISPSFKRIITLLATAALAGSVLVAAPATAHAKSYKGLQYVVEKGKAYVYDYTGSASSITIPAKLDGKPVVQVQIIGVTKVTKVNIKKATSLTLASFNGTRITSLDTSKNTKLVSLDVRATKMGKLSLKKNTKLTSLYAAGDVIAKSSLNAKKLTRIELRGKSTKFNIAKYPNLKRFAVYNTDVTSVDLSKGKNLETVDLGLNSKLAKLKVASPKLKTLNVSANAKLTSVAVGKSPKLTYLSVDGKAIKAVNLSGGSELRGIDIYGTSITSLNVSVAKKLTRVYTVECNKLAKLDVSALANLDELYVQDSAITELKLGNNKLKELYLRLLKKLQKVTLGKQPSLTQVTLPYVSGFGLAVDRSLQPKLTTAWVFPAGAANEDVSLTQVAIAAGFKGTIYNQY
jgi:hypothetical protein